MRKLLLAGRKPDSPVLSRQHQLALSRWENEGGAVRHRPQETGAIPGEGQSEPLQLTNNELEQLRTRVIALENLVIALLASKSAPQLDLAREMAAYISPRPSFTQHPLTIHAAAQMIRLVERSGYFRTNASTRGCACGGAKNRRK